MPNIKKSFFCCNKKSKMTTEITQKNSKNYVCLKCDFSSCNKNDYNRHLKTKKHKSNILQQDDNSKNSICPNCNKTYSDRSSLWRHKKKCIVLDETEFIQFQKFQHFHTKESNEDVITNKMLYDLIKQIISNPTTNQSYNTNSLNKTFNLQFFLNETCKDAMNLMDFVNSIQIDLSDTEKLGEIGYVEGITNIINKNLKLLDEKKRPIHCTDQKRETLYIKEDDKWEKEEESKPKMRKMIKYVAHKNAKNLVDFRSKYPECSLSHSKKSDQYNKMVLESMGGHGNNDDEKEDKIIKNVIKNVSIDKESNMIIT